MTQQGFDAAGAAGLHFFEDRLFDQGGAGPIDTVLFDQAPQADENVQIAGKRFIEPGRTHHDQPPYPCGMPQAQVEGDRRAQGNTADHHPPQVQMVEQRRHIIGKGNNAVGRRVTCETGEPVPPEIRRDQADRRQAAQQLRTLLRIRTQAVQKKQGFAFTFIQVVKGKLVVAECRHSGSGKVFLKIATSFQRWKSGAPKHRRPGACIITYLCVNAYNMSIRLDIWLIENDYFTSWQRAQMAIGRGLVKVNGQTASKPSQKVGPVDKVEVSGAPLPYVSQGGLKLEKAIKIFALDLQGRRVLDIGASTGGFTDCALQHGAARVYAVDVGTGQLDPTLRDNDRVRAYEGLHIRDLTLPHLDDEPVDLIVTDVSFISLTQVLPLLAPLLAPQGQVIALVKPQFELGEKVKLKGGIIRDEALRQQALHRVLVFAETLGFVRRGLTETEVADPEKKNIEYLLWLIRK